VAIEHPPFIDDFPIYVPMKTSISEGLNNKNQGFSWETHGVSQSLGIRAWE
jgi:hypothetical protein